MPLFNRNNLTWKIYSVQTMLQTVRNMMLLEICWNIKKLPAFLVVKENPSHIAVWTHPEHTIAVSRATVCRTLACQGTLKGEKQKCV